MQVFTTSGACTLHWKTTRLLWSVRHKCKLAAGYKRSVVNSAEQVANEEMASY